MSDKFSQNPKIYTIENEAGMTVSFIDWGATIISIRVPVGSKDNMQEMVIGPKHPADWCHQSCYMGATIGRYANRIDNCQFEANGKTYTIDAAGAPVALHGGKEGFDKRRFDVVEQSKNAITFKIVSPDGDQGFPGNFTLIVKYTLQNDGSLEIHYDGTCDQECPVCITNHSYFNLNGHRSSILGHEAKMNCEEILVLNEKSIPTGEVYNVTTRKDKVDNFNFTDFKIFAKDPSEFKEDENMRFTIAYDHPFIIKDQNSTKPCVTVRGEPINGKRVQLEVTTDYPAFQLYTGNWINLNDPETAIARDDGQPYEQFNGFAIEPEYFPDAPHLPQFKHLNPMVTPEQPLKKFIIYKFTVI